MSNQALQIPTTLELISRANEFDYEVSQPNQTHTYVCLKLDANHSIVPLLAQYTLLVSASLRDIVKCCGLALNQRRLPEPLKQPA